LVEEMSLKFGVKLRCGEREKVIGDDLMSVIDR